MKPLKPSGREKKRYLKIEGANLDKNIEKAVLSFIGSLGMSKAALKFIKKDKDSSIVSINREALNDIRASFATFPERIHVSRVSGTLEGLKK